MNEMEKEITLNEIGERFEFPFEFSDHNQYAVIDIYDLIAKLRNYRDSGATHIAFGGYIESLDMQGLTREVESDEDFEKRKKEQEQFEEWKKDPRIRAIKPTVISDAVKEASKLTNKGFEDRLQNYSPTNRLIERWEKATEALRPTAERVGYSEKEINSFVTSDVNYSPLPDDLMDALIKDGAKLAIWDPIIEKEITLAEWRKRKTNLNK